MRVLIVIVVIVFFITGLGFAQNMQSPLPPNCRRTPGKDELSCREPTPMQIKGLVDDGWVVALILPAAPTPPERSILADNFVRQLREVGVEIQGPLRYGVWICMLRCELKSNKILVELVRTPGA